MAKTSLKISFGEVAPRFFRSLFDKIVPKTKSMLVKLWGTRLYCIGAQVQLPLVCRALLYTEVMEYSSNCTSSAPESLQLFYQMSPKRPRIPPKKLQ
jgi:hypothetical protein